MSVALEAERICESENVRRRFPRPVRLLNDEELARQIAAGDRQAFAVAYDRHINALTRYCRGILMVREDAEDAAQSAMVAALRSLPERPPQLQLRAWLFRVAHNEAISILRRRRPHESLDVAEGVCSPDAAEAADTRARLRQLVTDLRSLPERQRGALVMRELCGLGYEEIAGAIGSTEGAAMQMVFEARSALVQCEAGRQLNCTGVQRMISGGDRRCLRARHVRAHMRSCDCCRAFEQSVKVRRRDFGLLVPVVAKTGPFALLGLLRLAGRGTHRITEVVNRGQSVPVGMSRAAVSAVLLVGGGGVAAHLAHHGAHGHRAAAAPRAIARQASVPVRRHGEIRTSHIASARPVHARPAHRHTAHIAAAAAAATRARPLLAGGPSRSRTSTIVSTAPVPVQAASTHSRPRPEPRVSVHVGSSLSGGVRVAAAAHLGAVSATVSGSVSPSTAAASVGTDAAAAGASARVAAAVCLLNCP